jgi:hypothetical protein
MQSTADKGYSHSLAIAPAQKWHEIFANVQSERKTSSSFNVITAKTNTKSLPMCVSQDHLDLDRRPEGPDLPRSSRTRSWS